MRASGQGDAPLGAGGSPSDPWGLDRLTDEVSKFAKIQFEHPTTPKAMHDYATKHLPEEFAAFREAVQNRAQIRWRDACLIQRGEKKNLFGVSTDHPQRTEYQEQQIQDAAAKLLEGLLDPYRGNGLEALCVPWMQEMRRVWEERVYQREEAAMQDANTHAGEEVKRAIRSFLSDGRAR